MSREIVRTRNFATEAAAFILDLARSAIAESGEFRIALSGGNTPRPVFSEIARSGRDIPWGNAIITFGDERCVPPEDDQSNYRMARECLLEPAGIPEESVLRMRGEIEPHAAAQNYQETLDALARKRSEPVYRHDLILLGLGEDGHTASLFPGSAALEENVRSVVANFAPKLETWRMTFTFPLINQARHVCFLVNSNKHAELIERVMAGDSLYPASRVNPASGNLTWILGEAA